MYKLILFKYLKCSVSHHGRQVYSLVLWDVIVMTSDAKGTTSGSPVVTLCVIHRPRLLHAVRRWRCEGVEV